MEYATAPSVAWYFTGESEPRRARSVGEREETYQETPEGHEAHSGLECCGIVDGADAADDQQAGRHGYHAIDNQWAAAQAFDQRPGADVAEELNSECHLGQAERVINAGKLEIVGEITADKVDADELLGDVDHADDQGPAAVGTLKQFSQETDFPFAFQLLLLHNRRSQNSNSVVDVEFRSVEGTERLRSIVVAALEDKP